MKPVELEGGLRLMVPEPSEVEGLFRGEVKEIETIEVLEPRMFAMSGFEYARARGLLTTPKVLFALAVIPWHHPSFRRWCPVQLYFPEGRPDTAALERIPRAGSFPLQVYLGIFHCFDCGIDAEGFAIRLEVYRPEEYPKGTEVARVVKRCPECGGDMRKPGLVEIGSVWRPPA